MTEKRYKELVHELSPNSPIWKDCFNAFWVGGLICVLGQAFVNFYTGLGERGVVAFGQGIGKLFVWDAWQQ